jgi:cytidine deaminase
LSENDMGIIPEDMISLAIKYLDKPYAPYSKFRVVSVVRGGSGRLYPGVNVENSSYGLTVCAERVAVFRAVTEGERSIREVLVCGLDTDEPLVPCGACLQVLSEFADPDAKVYSCSWRSGKVKVYRLVEMFPFAFKLGDRAEEERWSTE